MGSGGTCDNGSGDQIMTQNTYAEIVERIRGILLTPDGQEKIRKRRLEAARMAKGLRELKASGWVLKATRRQVGSDRTVFTVHQRTLRRATNGLEVSVELRGIGVGRLLPPPNGRGYPILETKQDARELEWGGSEARAYIRACANMKRTSPERHLQGVIVQALSTSPKHKLLQNLRPVRPANCMMEIPTPVDRYGNIGTGNIDILARTGRGRWPTFVICELKVDTTTPYDAMVQAIRYAVALDVEVNGITHELKPANRSVYRSLFGSNLTSQEPLRFGAMAIVPNHPGAEAKARTALDDLGTSSAWLDVMLFDPREDEQFRPVLRFRSAG